MMTDDLIGGCRFYNSFLLCWREKRRIETGTYFPDNKLVVVLAAERRQVLFIVGERETLDQHLVHLQTVLQLQSIEVPDDDIGLHKSMKR